MLVNETFFAELAEIEPTKLGCPKAVAVPRLMSTVTELLQIRFLPNRGFNMRTSRNPVYPVHEIDADEATHVEDESNHGSSDALPRVTTTTALKDHFFDTAGRSPTKKRIAKADNVSKPHDISWDM